ncbi:zinc finger protein 260-like isoform X5 [Micropterus dolomieu]|uniref:zinc finger protein 260-like isoform X5 n=1 Tax=Micropterus dolomieu TaxID=147949 RepID=UPI001E8EC614|nr:zinc finger protein 260-like isoform X5 [Micropterus dolomieu]
MSKVQTLRAFVQQRLSAAAEEIFELFERTIAEYEEELCGQRKLLDAVFKPEADVQLLLASKVQFPLEQQNWTPSLDQEDPQEPPHIKEEWTPSLDQEDPQDPPHIKEEWTPSLDQEDPPEPPHIKEEWTPSLDQEDPLEPPHIKEQHELWTSQERKKLPEKTQSSQLHQRLTEQMETEADGEDCGGPEPTRNSDPGRLLQPDTSDSSEPETDDSCDWEVTKEPQSGSNPLQNNGIPASLDQEGPPELPRIEEQEELYTSQERDKLLGLEEADITKFTFTPVPVKSGDDEEKPLSSQLHKQMETEADGEDCGGPEPARNSDPDRHLQPDTDDKTSNSSEPDSDDSCDWEETREPQSGSNPLQNNEVSERHQECNTGETSSSTSECATSFGDKRQLQEDKGLNRQPGEKPFSCSVCGKRYIWKASLTKHRRIHSEGKRFSCSVCKKGCSDKSELSIHMRTHTGEKPFICSECGKRFGRKHSLDQHSMVHTGEKPFSCSVCGRRFAQRIQLTLHLRVHTGEKPYTCSVCKKSFSQASALSVHLRIHTGEKPFSCKVCGKTFVTQGQWDQHMRSHTGEKPFRCKVCNKTFSQYGHVKNHKCAGESRGTK